MPNDTNHSPLPETAAAWWSNAAKGVFISLTAAFLLWFTTFTVDSFGKMYEKLVTIDRTTAVFNNQLYNINKQLEDHEMRLKDLEKHQRDR